ncbi:MAG: secE [Phycisphaerales bacterium]|nr:secE [Phycisphaerales bacterium]
MAAVTHSNGSKLMSDDEGPDERPSPSAGSNKGGFFTVYKKGQGYYTRLGTALCAGLLIVVLGLFVYEQAGTFSSSQTKTVPAIATAVMVALGAIVAWRIMNQPRNVDFLISTDSEMKKVNWTSREELIGSTRIVIIFLFVIALLLFLIDVLTGSLFYQMGLIKVPPL